MRRFDVGDRIRIDIPDKTDPDYDCYHREVGTVVEILPDNAGKVTGDERDGLSYRIELEGGDTMDFRWRDLRPIVERSSE